MSGKRSRRFSQPLAAVANPGRWAKATRRLPGLLLIPLLLLMTSACLSGPVLEDSGNQVATIVAATMAAIPTEPGGLALPSVPAPEATLPPAPATMPPPSETPTITPTSGPTPIPPSDPRFGLDLEQPDVRDDFSSTRGWFPQVNAGADHAFADGAFRAIDLTANNSVFWSTSRLEEDDTFIEIDARIGSCTGRDSAGVILRVSKASYANGYALEISCDGAYRLREFIQPSTSPATLAGWTESGAIIKGPNQTNRIGLLARGSLLYAFVNGELLVEREDNTLTSGVFGLYANAVNTAGLTIQFDNFALWRLGP